MAFGIAQTLAHNIFKFLHKTRKPRADDCMHIHYVWYVRVSMAANIGGHVFQAVPVCTCRKFLCLSEHIATKYFDTLPKDALINIHMSRNIKRLSNYDFEKL